MKEITDKSVCEGCGVKGSEDNPLLQWIYYNFTDKIMCLKCTDAETKRKLKMVSGMIAGKVKRK